MKLFSIQIIFCLILLGFVSCSEDDKSVSSTVEYSSSSSSFTLVESFPSGTTFYINPEIRLNGELTLNSTTTAQYTNNESVSDFPLTSETVTLNLKKIVKELVMYFTVADGTNVEISIYYLNDVGNDGYYDEFYLQARVGKNVVASASSKERYGRFIGSTKPKNPNHSKPDKMQRVPNEEQFDSLALGTLFYYKISGSNVGTISFNQSGDGDLYHPEDLGHSHNIRWRYLYNSGSPTLEYKTVEDNKHYSKMQLTFTDFYEGTFVQLEGYEDGVNFPAGQTGEFRFFEGISYIYSTTNKTEHDFKLPSVSAKPDDGSDAVD